MRLGAPNMAVNQRPPQPYASCPLAECVATPAQMEASMLTAHLDVSMAQAQDRQALMAVEPGGAQTVEHLIRKNAAEMHPLTRSSSPQPLTSLQRGEHGAGGVPGQTDPCAWSNPDLLVIG